MAFCECPGRESSSEILPYQTHVQLQFVKVLVRWVNNCCLWCAFISLILLGSCWSQERRVTNCGGLTLTGCQVPTKAALSLVLLNWTEERKYDERLVGQDKDKERSLTSYCHGQNRLDLGKLVWFITDQIGVGLWEIKPNFKNTFALSPFFLALTSLPIFCASTPWAVQGDREWDLQSVHHTLSLPLLPPHALPLLQCGVPPMGDSSSQTSPMWVLPTGCSSSWTGPA